MNDYKILLYQIDTDDGPEWIAEYPELKYCSGGGKTQIEALQMAEEEKRFYLEALKNIGEEAPVPNKFHNYSGKFSVRVSKSLHAKAVVAAQEEGLSLNALVSEALAEKVYNNDGISSVKKLSDATIKILTEQYENMKMTNNQYINSMSEIKRQFAREFDYSVYNYHVLNNNLKNDNFSNMQWGKFNKKMVMN